MTDQDERLRPARRGTQMGATALGRLHLRVLKDDGVEDMLLERRWPEEASARTWCERMAGDTAPGVEVLEIHVTLERWEHPKSWQTAGPHPVAETIQVGVCDSLGRVRWSSPQQASTRTKLRPLSS